MPFSVLTHFPIQRVSGPYFLILGSLAKKQVWPQGRFQYLANNQKQWVNLYTDGWMTQVCDFAPKSLSDVVLCWLHSGGICKPVFMGFRFREGTEKFVNYKSSPPLMFSYNHNHNLSLRYLFLRMKDAMILEVKDEAGKAGLLELSWQKSWRTFCNGKSR